MTDEVTTHTPPEQAAEQPHLAASAEPKPEAKLFNPDKATLTVTKGKVSLTGDIDARTGKGVEDLLNELERRSTPQCDFGEDGRCVASQVPRWAIEAGEATCPVHGGLPPAAP